jgi:hypothetical protein
MLSSIELYYQALLETAEVSDERTDNELAAELETVELTRAETSPQLLFSVGLIAPQLTGALFQCRNVEDRHVSSQLGLNPHPSLSLTARVRARNSSNNLIDSRFQLLLQFS